MAELSAVESVVAGPSDLFADVAPAAQRRKRSDVYLGIDLRAEARSYCRQLQIPMPTLKFRHTDRHGCSGRAWSWMQDIGAGVLALGVGHHHSGKVVVTIGRAAPSRVLELLLHELVHVATPNQNHSERFCALLVRTARAVWGVEVSDWLNIKSGDARYRRAYAIGDVIAAELQRRLDSEAYVPMPAPELPAVIAVSSDDRAKAREARLRQQLGAAERKLRQAEARVKKLRVKVRYYDRKAAAAADAAEESSVPESP